VILSYKQTQTQTDTGDHDDDDGGSGGNGVLDDNGWCEIFYRTDAL